MDPSSQNPRLGPYRLVGELGRGGMGTVFRAIRDDDTFHREVALKVVRSGLAAEAVLRRFRAEGQILARLEHPNIAVLYDGGTTEDGRPYLVMELVAGRALDDFCREHGLLARPRLALFRTVCEAVHYLHQNLVVHRDLKPSNVLVTAEGVPKILDFGIAKLLDDDATGAAPTATLLPAMTPEYASPEQVTGSAITTASDVYSLGVMLYEILAGRRPYEIASGSPEAIVRAVCRTEPERPSQAARAAAPRPAPDATLRVTARGTPISPADLEGDLDAIVMKALRKEPEHRYVSAHDLSEDIRRHLEGKPVVARGDAFAYRLGRLVRSHRSLAAGAPLLVLTLFFGFLGAAREARVAEANRVRAERRFEDARRLANSLVFEVHEAIEDLPGATAARALLLKRASEHLDALAADAPANPDLAEELASAYQKLAEVQGFKGAANLGDTGAALANEHKALALRRSLALAAPSDVGRQDRLAASLVSISYTEPDPRKARDLAREAVAIAKRLTQGRPGDPKLERRLAVAHYAVAASLTADGDLSGATRSYEAAATIFQALYAADPEGGSARRDLALTEKRLSGLLTAQGEFAKALLRSRRAADLDETALRAHPQSARERRDLSVSLVDLGEALVNTKDVPGSLPHFRRALAIRRELLAADAQNELARRDVASALTRLAAALAEHGDGPGATAAIDEARSVLPKDEGMESQRSEQAAILARVHEAAGRPRQALQWWREARSLRLAQIRGAETSYAWLARVDYLDICRGLGRRLEAQAAHAPSVAERTRLWSEARSVFEEGVREAEALAAEKHLLGPKVRLADDLRAGLGRAQDALARSGVAQLTPGASRP